MHRLVVIANVLMSAATITLVFSCDAVHEASQAWRRRPDDRDTTYERADACRPESWR